MSESFHDRLTPDQFEEFRRAELAKIEAEEKLFSERAYGVALENWQNERVKAVVEASGEAARVFPFYGEVVKPHVAGCVDALSQWFREDSERPITVVFNSPGGEVFEGLALYDQIHILRGEGAIINTHSIGQAASMGAILLQAGEVRRMSRHSYMLIHEISGGAIGNASMIADQHEFVQRLQTRLLEILAQRSTLTPEEIREKWTRRDWWLDADEALELGFVDEVSN
jgi:ATP-dependent Clp protease protease subunit